MSLFIESIKYLQGKLYNLGQHQIRVDKARKNLLNLTDQLSLENEIKIPPYLTNDLYKCRIVYSDRIHKVEFTPYLRKSIGSLKMVEDNQIEYSYKFEDRTRFASLLSNCNAEEIIIIKNGRVTDSSYSNLVFFDGTKYFTPSTPLLEGTKRGLLLNSGEVVETEIKIEEVKKFKLIYLINAMMDIDPKFAISTDNIY